MDLSSPQILDLPEHLDLVPTCSSSSSSTKMPVYRRSNLFSIPNPDDDPFDLASVSSRGSAGSSSLATPTPDVGLLVNIGRDSDVFHSNKTHSGALENWELLKCEAQSLAGDLKKKKSDWTPGKPPLSLDSFSPIASQSPLLTDDRGNQNPNDFLVRSSPESSPPIKALSTNKPDTDLGPPPEIEEGPLNDSVSIETAHEDENPPASNDVPKPPLKIKEGARPPKNPAPRDRAPPTRSASKPSAQRRQTFVTHKKPGPTPVKHVPTFNLGRKAKATPELINFSVAPSPKTTVDQLISLSDDEHLKHLHEVIQPKTVDNQLINLHDSVEIPNENANPNSKSNVADLLGLEDALIPSTTSEKLSCTSCHCSGSTEPQQPFTPSAFSDKPDLNLATPNPLLPLNQNRNPIPPSLAKNRRSLLAARPETVTLSHRGPAPNPKLQPRRSLMTQSPAVKHNAHQVLAGNPPNPRRSVVGTPSHSARTPLRHGVTPAVPERKPHSYLRRSVASTVHSATASAKKPPVSSYVRDTPSLPKSTTAGTPQRSRSQAITTPSNAHLMNTPSKPNPSMVRRSLIATPSKLNPPSQIATPSSSLTRGTPMGMSKATPMSMSKTNPMSMTKATPMSMSKAPSISFPSTKSKPPLGMFRPRAGLTVASGPASRKALVATQQFGSRTIRPADDGDLGVRALNSMTPSGNQSLGMRSRRVSGLPSPIRKIH